MGSLTQVPQRGQRTILHVDHYAANISLIQAIIDRRKDLRLITATTGAQCVELAHAHLPDVILMEIILRDVNGIDVLKCLRRSDVTAHIPVIAFSTFALLRQFEATRAAGFFYCLKKPFKISELMQAIDDALKCVVQNREAAFGCSPTGLRASALNTIVGMPTMVNFRQTQRALDNISG
jgi:CheY-like chemotaxis protein